LIDVYSLVSGVLAAWAATGFKSMIIQHRETTDGHREDVRGFLEPVFDPLFAILITLAQQKRTAHAARHAVVPASQG
jgi:hypothetical protein